MDTGNAQLNIFENAAGQGNLAAVEASLHSGVDVNATLSGGATALIRAAYNSHVEIVRYLIQARAKYKCD